MGKITDAAASAYHANIVHLPYLCFRLHIRSLGYQQLGNGCVSFLACLMQWCPVDLQQKQRQGAQQLQYSLCQTSGQPRKPACIRHKHEMNHLASPFEVCPHLQEVADNGTVTLECCFVQRRVPL